MIRNLTRKQQILLGLFVWLGGTAVLFLLIGSDGKNDEFKPQNEFKLDPWIDLKLSGIDMSINKAVLYVFLACAITAGTMIWIARRMQDRPNRVQTLVEGAYDLTYTQIAKGNMPSATAAVTLGRLWLLTLSILLAGKLAEREDGLAAAVLAAILVTAHLGAQAIDHLAPKPETEATA